MIYDYNGNVIKAKSEKTYEVPWVTSMHRGYSSDTVHENTIAAYKRAFLNGADAIETDARLTSDGVYVVSHDATITVNDTTYTISSETAQTITNLVLSHDEEYGDCKLPTLESVLRLCAHAGIFAFIDCKSIDADTLAELVISCGMSGKTSYANTTIENANTILSIDKNASFTISYSDANLEAWGNALDDEVIRKSYMWGTGSDQGIINNVRETGFGYLMTPITYLANKLSFLPDAVEFETNIDCSDINKKIFRRT